jgi:hypothetical protein
MRGAVALLPQYVFMASCSIKRWIYLRGMVIRQTQGYVYLLPLPLRNGNLFLCMCFISKPIEHISVTFYIGRSILSIKR